MRSIIIAVATAALAAFPCAWDSNPRETAPIASILAGQLDTANPAHR